MLIQTNNVTLQTQQFPHYFADNFAPFYNDKLRPTEQKQLPNDDTNSNILQSKKDPTSQFFDKTSYKLAEQSYPHLQSNDMLKTSGNDLAFTSNSLLNSNNNMVFPSENINSNAEQIPELSRKLGEIQTDAKINVPLGKGGTFHFPKLYHACLSCISYCLCLNRKNAKDLFSDIKKSKNMMASFAIVLIGNFYPVLSSLLMQQGIFGLVRKQRISLSSNLPSSRMQGKITTNFSACISMNS